MNDCVHFDGNPKDCAIFGIPCEEPAWQKGCYMSIAQRDLMLKDPEQRTLTPAPEQP